MQDLAWIWAYVHALIVGARGDDARWIELRDASHVRPEHRHRARAMAAARVARRALVTAAVVATSFRARIVDDEVRKADRVGQGQSEHEDACKRHLLDIARWLA